MNKKNIISCVCVGLKRTTKCLSASVLLVSASACGGGGAADTSTPISSSLPISVVAAQRFTSADYSNAVQQLYVSYFGRPADPGGLSNFSAALLAEGAPTGIQLLNSAYGTNPTIRTLVDAFGTSAESNNLYTGDTTSFITAIYRNVLNRAPDSEGLAFWVNAIDHGGLTKGNAALSIMAGALANTTTQGRIDAALVNNKITVASKFTASLATSSLIAAYSGDSAAAAARSMLSQVDNSTDTNSYLATIKSTLTRLVTPIAVERSAYENKIKAGEALGPQVMPSEVPGGNAVAFADFFQDGTYSMVTSSLEYIPDWSQTKFGHIHFYTRDTNGQWIDKTSVLLQDTTGCLHPRKAVVADLNGDSKPDVFFACHGYDRSPWPGEHPRILLSQPDGTYRNVELPVTCFCHGASAADFTGQGYADIVVTDNMIEGTPYFLSNNRNGTFTVDKNRLPTSLRFKAIFSAELIDFDNTGKYDLWLGGNEPGATANETTTEYDIAPTIFKNDGNNSYLTSTQLSLPINADYGLPLDIVFKNGFIYLLRTNIGGGPTNYGVSFYTTTAVQKINYATRESSMPYIHSGQYSDGMTWVNWITSYDGKIVPMDRTYQIEIPWR